MDYEFRKNGHSTIHNFQRRIVGTETNLSAQQLSILLKKELINLDDVSIDRTKIKSVANKSSNVYRVMVGYHEMNLEKKNSKSIKSTANAVDFIASLLDDDSNTEFNISDSC